MNLATNLSVHELPTEESTTPRKNPTKFILKKERKILKIFLLAYLHHTFSELLKNDMKVNNDFFPECYTMDSEILQLLINGIIETEQYTLEGIAYYTRIPLDVIYDAVSGIKYQLSLTSWMRIVYLYMQVKPEMTQAVIDKLIMIKNKNPASFSILLNET